MNIVINDFQNLMNQDGLVRTESRARAAFQRFVNDLVTLNITVADINGPRGGVDKECRVFATIRGRSNIRVQARKDSISGAIQVAIDRSIRAIGRAIGRRVARQRRRLTSGRRS